MPYHNTSQHKSCSTDNWDTKFPALQNATNCIKIELYQQHNREQYYSKNNEDLKTEFDRKAHILHQLDIRATVAIYDT